MFHIVAAPVPGYAIGFVISVSLHKSFKSAVRRWVLLLSARIAERGRVVRASNGIACAGNDFAIRISISR
jgi:hypothetical protein